MDKKRKSLLRLPLTNIFASYTIRTHAEKLDLVFDWLLMCPCAQVAFRLLFLGTHNADWGKLIV